MPLASVCLLLVALVLLILVFLGLIAIHVFLNPGGY